MLHHKRVGAHGCTLIFGFEGTFLDEEDVLSTAEKKLEDGQIVSWFGVEFGLAVHW